MSDESGVKPMGQVTTTHSCTKCSPHGDYPALILIGDPFRVG
jgi:hypothetical protein